MISEGLQERFELYVWSKWVRGPLFRDLVQLGAELPGGRHRGRVQRNDCRQTPPQRFTPGRRVPGSAPFSTVDVVEAFRLAFLSATSSLCSCKSDGSRNSSILKPFELPKVWQ